MSHTASPKQILAAALCLLAGCVCTQNFDPVCGRAGKTYPNSGCATCANVEVASEGACGKMSAIISTFLFAMMGFNVQRSCDSHDAEHDAECDITCISVCHDGVREGLPTQQWQQCPDMMQSEIASISVCYSEEHEDFTVQRSTDSNVF